MYVRYHLPFKYFPFIDEKTHEAAMVRVRLVNLQ